MTRVKTPANPSVWGQISNLSPIEGEGEGAFEL